LQLIRRTNHVEAMAPPYVCSPSSYLRWRRRWWRRHDDRRRPGRHGRGAETVRGRHGYTEREANVSIRDGVGLCRRAVDIRARHPSLVATPPLEGERR